MTSLALRSLSFLVLGVAVSSAKAAPLHVEVEGIYYSEDSHLSSLGTGNVVTQTGGLAPFNRLLNTTQYFTLANDEFMHYYRLDMHFFFEGPGYFADSPTLKGTWRVTGGDGPYANTLGSGTFVQTGVFLSSTGPDAGLYKVHTVIDGQVAPVPEPASLCALGLGAVAMIRRRAVRK